MAALFWSEVAAVASTGEKPNIIYILADDCGLGDVKTYGGNRCKIDTPHMDRLAEKGIKPLREAVLHHSIDGSFAIRQGKWKLALCPGSGGWSKPMPPSGKKNTANAEPIKDSVQLFDLEADPAETKNLSKEHPEIFSKLTARVQRIIDASRSTPGEPQKNNGEASLYPD